MSPAQWAVVEAIGFDDFSALHAALADPAGVPPPPLPLADFVTAVCMCGPWAHTPARVEALSALLGCGADPNGPDTDGILPLVMAIVYQNAPLVRRLVEAGASLDVPLLRTVYPYGDDPVPTGTTPRALLVRLVQNHPEGEEVAAVVAACGVSG